MFLTFKPSMVPDLWYFVDPDSNFRYEAPTREALLRYIVSYREQNGYAPLEALPAVVDNFLCNQPQYRGMCQPNKKLPRSLWAYIKGGVALLENIAYKEIVSQKLADARSNTCFTCPNNIFPDKGPFLQYSDQIAVATVGQRRSIRHSELGNCGCCSCPLRAKVFYAGKLTLTPEELSCMPDFCWQKKEFLSYNNTKP